MKALIWGVTGQSGSYLAELLLSKGYEVYGVSRRSSTPNTGRIAHLLGEKKFTLLGGDITDPLCVDRLINQVGPDEVYNLAAQSEVGTSFSQPCSTWESTAQGALNILEALRCNTRLSKVRFYQASSSEMWGSAWSHDDHRWGRVECLGGSPEGAFQDEETPFCPNSPYAVAKLAAHNLVRVYRQSYGLFLCSGILCNHESSRRAPYFVTQKIAEYAALLSLGRTMGPLKLGNLDAKRDWGFAGDYMEAAWLMLQQGAPDDYVVATGEVHSVREFVSECEDVISMPIPVEVDPSLFRPNEVPYLRGRADKARRVLGWAPKTSFSSLVRQMVEGARLRLARV